MTYGHSAGLPPWEAPAMIAEKCKIFPLGMAYGHSAGLLP